MFSHKYVRHSVYLHLTAFLILPYYTRTKWHKRKSCHLEKLLSKWNSNYRNAPNTTNYQVSKCHFPSKKYNPYKIYQKRKHAISIHDFFSKRPECQGCKFKALQTYRNSNNCNTPYASCKNPGQAAQQSSKYKPKDIAYSSHDNTFPLIQRLIFFCNFLCYLIYLFESFYVLR